MNSFDAAPTPNALRPRTRTKYTPGGAIAERPVPALPVSNVTMLLAPLVEPASTL
jgi:hypothetical protein